MDNLKEKILEEECSICFEPLLIDGNKIAGCNCNCKYHYHLNCIKK